MELENGIIENFVQIANQKGYQVRGIMFLKTYLENVSLPALVFLKQ